MTFLKQFLVILRSLLCLFIFFFFLFLFFFFLIFSLFLFLISLWFFHLFLLFQPLFLLVIRFNTHIFVTWHVRLISFALFFAFFFVNKFHFFFMLFFFSFFFNNLFRPLDLTFSFLSLLLWFQLQYFFLMRLHINRLDVLKDILLLFLITSFNVFFLTFLLFYWQRLFFLKQLIKYVVLLIFCIKKS